jgi:hypothetical protein
LGGWGERGKEKKKERGKRTCCSVGVETAATRYLQSMPFRWFRRGVGIDVDPSLGQRRWWNWEGGK